MSDLNINVINTDSIQGVFDSLQEIGKWSVGSIVKSIIDKNITATGRTQKSINYRILGENNLQIYAELGERAPISTLQYGRDAGKQPPIDNLKEWILSKRITIKPIAYKRASSENWKPKYTPQERGLNSLAWAISIHIKENGTKRFREPDNTVYSPILFKTVQLFAQFIAKQNEQIILNILAK